MEVSREELNKIAHLARIAMTGEEKDNMLADFNKILAFVEKVKELDLEGVEPLMYISERTNAMREDVPGDECLQEESLKNAPDHDTAYFKVPRVVSN